MDTYKQNTVGQRNDNVIGAVTRIATYWMNDNMTRIDGPDKKYSIRYAIQYGTMMQIYVTGLRGTR